MSQDAAVGEAVIEVHCVAAPIRDEMGVVVAAVSLTVPASRFVRSREEFERAVRTAGADISRRIGSEEAPVAGTVRDDPTAPPPADLGTHRRRLVR